MPQVMWPSPETRSPIFEAAHFLADLDDLADVFVADVHRHGNRLLRPLVPLPDVDVGAADRGLADADQDVVVADLRLLDLGQREPGSAFEFCECLHHGFRPSAALDLKPDARRQLACRPCANAATARSICSSVCAALICVRMRALPLRHHRVGEADDVDAFVEQRVGHARRQRGVAQHHRHDRMLAGHEVEASAGHRAPETLAVVACTLARSLAPSSLASSFEHLERGGGDARRQRVGEQIRPRALAQQSTISRAARV